MKQKMLIFVIFILLASGLFLFLEGNKIKYLSVFLPHKEKPIKASKDVTNKTLYGVTVDMSQLLPTSSKYVKNSKGEDLIDIAKRLGINLFRITSVSSSFGTNGYIYTKRQWDTVLNKMDKNGVKALILIESPKLNPNDYTQNYLNLVKSYVIDSGALDNPNVYGVDIRNEPLISDTNIKVLSTAAKMIKAKYPKVLITVGGWRTHNLNSPPGGPDPYIWMNGTDGKKLSSIVDFYSIHTYEYDKPLLGVYPDSYNLTVYSVEKVLPELSDKPILIEEFGAANGDAITDQHLLGSVELQANVYDGVYEAIGDLKDKNVLGSVAFLFMKRGETLEGFALAKDNGDYLYPAAYVLQKYATGKSDVNLDLPFRNIPNDFLLSTLDNNKTIDVKVQDIIGLRLNLNKDYVNSTRVSNPSMLFKSQALTRENNGDYIDAVFHVVKTGKTSIKVIGRNHLGEITRFTVNVVASD